MKKITNLFICSILLIMCSFVIGNVADAEIKTTSDGFRYEISDGEVTIEGYRGSATEVTIPSKIEGYSVTSIGNHAFSDCSSLTSIEIPNSVTSIGYYAFCHCESLTSISIPNSVTSIGRCAFDETKWLENKQKENPLVIVNGILIDGRTCSGNVTIPNNVTSIGEGAFEECESLTSISIPNSVTSIGDCA